MSNDEEKKAIEILREYGLDDVVSISRIGGFTATNYRIIAGARSYVLKMYPAHMRAHAEFAAAASDMAASASIPTPHPLPSRKSQLISQPRSEGPCATLLPFVEGCVLHSEDLHPAQLLSVAALAARCHEKLAKLTLPLRDQREFLRTHLHNFEERREKILLKARALLKNDGRRNSVEECIFAKEGIARIVSPALEGKNEWKLAIVHGDFHNENILFIRGSAEWVLDLEEIRLGWAGEDVVTFAIFAADQAKISEKAISRMSPLVQSFMECTSVSPKEMSASIDMTILRLALSLRLEERALVDDSGIAIQLLHRDIQRFTALQRNLQELHEAWA